MTKKVGIYVRLSKEDTRSGESVSIENQKLMLAKHVSENGWELREIYQDDGFSGTNQNRPAFQRMIADVESGFINTVLIKDLSRLGRNYLEVGNLAEVFLPKHGCELISLNEQLDEMMVFRNWFNEQHSKTTSVKVRMGKRVSAQSGKFVGAYAPYGYLKDPANRHKLIVDPAAAPVVRKIFEMRAGGAGHRAIAAKLNSDMITPPRGRHNNAAVPPLGGSDSSGGNSGGYRRRHCEPAKQSKICTMDCFGNCTLAMTAAVASASAAARHSFRWSENTIRDMLKNEAYIGNTISGKTGSVSYKNPKQIRKEESDWIRATATHEPIIPPALWEKVNSMTKRRYKSCGSKPAGMFAGLLHCTTCGVKLRTQTEQRLRKDGTQYVSYICSTYARHGKAVCSIHGISEKALVALVADHVGACMQAVNYDKTRIEEAVRTARSGGSYNASRQNELKAHEKQLAKLDLLIENLYMDKVSGLVPDSLFKRQVKKYEAERVGLAKVISKMQARKVATPVLAGYEPPTVDAETLRLLVKKIAVGEVVYVDGQRICDVEVVYRFEKK